MIEEQKGSSSRDRHRRGEVHRARRSPKSRGRLQSGPTTNEAVPGVAQGRWRKSRPRGNAARRRSTQGFLRWLFQGHAKGDTDGLG
ncbi:uncharacterized protein M6B38_403500 [Iris pallida]|uniref:Uncharacterized protein n=1 Tax=Iris pallida TaxID=29817 RepID=A0AAX6FSM5_IRIPA|nr:uncharacterized protein M6B38_403500 [Iris pallida]